MFVVFFFLRVKVWAGFVTCFQSIFSQFFFMAALTLIIRLCPLNAEGFMFAILSSFLDLAELLSNFSGLLKEMSIYQKRSRVFGQTRAEI